MRFLTVLILICDVISHTVFKCEGFVVQNSLLKATSRPDRVVDDVFVSLPMATNNEDSTSTYDVILYDGVCNFCNTWVDILLRIDVGEKFKFAPLQSEVGKKLLTSIGKEADDISSVLLVKDDLTYYDKSRCVIQVLEEP